MFKIQNFFTQYKTPILYTGGSFIKSIAQLLVGFVVARYISPNDLGIWNTVTLVLAYSTLLQGGLINGLNLELPSALGKNEILRADRMAGTAFTLTVATSLATFAIGILVFFLTNHPDEKIKYGTLAVTFLIALSYYQNYLTATFRSKSSFLRLSLLQIIEAIINLSTLVLVVYYLYFGMIFKIVLVTSVTVAMLHFYRPIKVGFIWDKKELINMLKVGFPIFVLAFSESFSSTIDKLWLVKYSDMTDVGLYSFAMYSMSLFSLFSLSVATYIYPRMTFNYGQNNDKSILRKYVKKITLILFAAQTPLAILGYFIIPIAIATFFPKYLSSSFCMQILLIAGLFKGCVVGVNVLWSIKAWKYMVMYQTTYSLLLIFFTFLGVKYTQNKIEGAALGIMAANFLNLISGLSFSYLATKENFVNTK